MLAEREAQVWPEECFAQAVASEIILDTRRALGFKERASWLVSAGRDGEKIAGAIAASPLLAGLPLERLHVFFADERFSQDPSLLNSERLSPFFSVLEGWGMPEANAHPFPQLSSSREGALAYEEEIRDLGFAEGCDIAWLSCGPDGHVASIFPGKDWKGDLAIWEDDSPKPPKSRMSVSLKFVMRSREVFLVAAQKEKKEIAKKALKTFYDPLVPATFCQGREKSAWRFSTLTLPQIF